MSSATPPHHPREGSKNVKFSEMLVNVLEQRLENIAMGKDSAYVLPPSWFPPPSPFHSHSLPAMLTVSKKVFEPAQNRSCLRRTRREEGPQHSPRTASGRRAGQPHCPIRQAAARALARRQLSLSTADSPPRRSTRTATLAAIPPPCPTAILSRHPRRRRAWPTCR